LAQALALGWILARKMGSAVRLDQGVDNLARPLVQVLGVRICALCWMVSAARS
jgi:hypothetical protein